MSHGVMLAWILVFALVHSGLAGWRLRVESVVGPRAYRVLFALTSLGLAVPMLVYFINHRYDGWLLWDLRGSAWVQGVVLVLSAVSFLFLYPATFNLLEVAAIAKPQMRLYETGITRITRHPQLTGMTLWCVAHVLWLGTSFALVTALGLVSYHSFAVWHGDRRLYTRYGEAFLALKARTSVIPFAAILQGHQTLVLKEFLRPAYLGVLAFVVLVFVYHPWLVERSAQVFW
nr:NnrU family protein [Candidatus Cyanaurora vandensis]